VLPLERLASASGVTSPRHTRMLPNASRIELDAA
jgi:hypothetical protein